MRSPRWNRLRKLDRRRACGCLAEVCVPGLALRHVRTLDDRQLGIGGPLLLLPRVLGAVGDGHRCGRDRHRLRGGGGHRRGAHAVLLFGGKLPCLQFADDPAHLVPLRLRLGRADLDRHPAQIVHKLASPHRVDRFHLIHHVEHDANERARAPMASPAVHVQGLAVEQVLDELRPIYELYDEQFDDTAAAKAGS